MAFTTPPFVSCQLAMALCAAWVVISGGGAVRFVEQPALRESVSFNLCPVGMPSLRGMRAEPSWLPAS